MAPFQWWSESAGWLDWAVLVLGVGLGVGFVAYLFRKNR